jgi:hypothetical protein
MGPRGCPETSLTTRSTLRVIPEKRRSHSHRGGSLIWRTVTGCVRMRATCPMHRAPNDFITLELPGEDYKLGRTELCSVFEIAATLKNLVFKIHCCS